MIEKFLIIGSSLGAWLGLLQFQDFKKQIIGFIGIGSAPEFLDRLIWQKLKNNEKKMFNNWRLGLYRYSCSSVSCLLYTSPSPRDRTRSRMPSSA